MKDTYYSTDQHKCKQERDKRMPIWKLAMLDILIAGISLSVFSLFHHVLPSVSKNNGIDIVSVNNGVKPTFNLPSKVTPSNTEVTTETNTPELSTPEPTETQNTVKTPKPTNKPTNTKTPEPTPVPLPFEYAKKYDDSPYERNIYLLNTYKNEDSEIYINKIEIGEGQEKVTYYTADVFVTDIQQIQTAFATGKYGRNIRENILEMADNNNAILAISGDFYTNNDIGVVIRNGYFYRSKDITSDVCVLFIDGTIKTYSPSEFNIDDVLAKGAWQAWTFGPALLDSNGNMLKSFNTSSYIKQDHPRCAIGFVAPGHYVLTVVDGRNAGYSCGVNIEELAQIMYDEGCVSAYNLDGGKTAQMVFNGMYVNSPTDGGRTVSDILFINR